MLNSNNKDTKVKKTTITVGEQLDNWLENEKSYLRKVVYNRYKIMINHHLKPYFGDISLKKLTLQNIKNYFDLKRNTNYYERNNQKLSESTLRRHYSTLNAMLQNAKKLKLINTNPLKDFEFQSSEVKNSAIMTKEECKRLLTAARKDELMYRFIYTSLMTGMRVNEILALEWDEVNFQENYIEIKQVLTSFDLEVQTINSTRKIIMNDKLLKLFQKHKNQQFDLHLKHVEKYNFNRNFVFCNPQGYPYSQIFYKKKFRGILKKASLDERFDIYSLRLTHDSLQRNNKIPVKISCFLTSEHTIQDTISMYKENN